MELSSIQQRVEEQAKQMFKDVESNIKKLEEKTQPRWKEIQQRLDSVLDLRNLTQNEKLKELKGNWQQTGKQWKENGTQWAEENYSNLLDTLGIATKDEVDTLRKKLSSLQRKISNFGK